MSNSNDVSTIQTLYQKAHALLPTANPLTIPNYNSVTFDEARRIIDTIGAILQSLPRARQRRTVIQVTC